MTKKKIIEYTINIVVSLILAVVIAGTFALLANHKAKIAYSKQPKVETQRDDAKILAGLIAKYEKAGRQNPTDYKINTKLGNFYSILGDDKEAESNYKKAAAKTVYGVYSPFFDLGYFYISTNRLNKAEEAVNQIVNKRKKVVLEAKGDFYVNLADAYAQYKDFEIAIDKYEEAAKYYESADKSDKIDIVNTRILEAYESLADKNLEKKKLTSAISNLENSLHYKDLPIISYKLAILYKDIDPVESYRYIRKVYDTDPGIINFDIYEQIIVNVMKYHKDLKMPDEEELYAHKLKLVKKFKQRYVVKPDDFGVYAESSSIRKHIFSDRKTISLKFRIANFTKKDANPLYLIVEVNNNGEDRVIFKDRITSKENPLKAMGESDLIKVKYTYEDPMSTNYTPEIKFTFKVAKKQGMRMINAGIIEIPKQISTKNTKNVK